MSPLHFIVLVLATFRLTVLLTKDKGPGWLILKFRRWVKRKAPPKAHLDEGVECSWCASLWFGPAIAVAEFFLHGSAVYEVAVVALALSGGGVILNQAFTKTK
jgi:hypothetical protein